nr:uncharacterized protein LOC129381782 [Dermacentor andersoni]
MLRDRLVFGISDSIVQQRAALPPLQIELKQDAQPKFLNCRSIPFAPKDDVITELEKLERGGVLQPTQYSEWATPVVIVRICQVATYLDDILVASEAADEHYEVLTEVLNRLSKAGLRIQGDKCQFFKESLEYFGHRIDANGINPSKAKVEAIHKAPAPKNKKELQAFLGMVNFYYRFLKGQSQVAEVLYRLLDSDQAVEYPPLRAADVASATMRDPCLSRVKKWVATGWPEQGVPPEYAAYQMACPKAPVNQGQELLTIGMRQHELVELRSISTGILSIEDACPLEERYVLFGQTFFRVWP